jgi:O-antigen/teichoic acid export membrane protein
MMRSFTAQTTSSVASIALSVVAGSRLDVEEFGYFAFAFAGSMLLVGSVRAFTAEVLLFAQEEHNDTELRRRAGSSLMAAALLLLLAIVPAAIVLSLIAGMPLGMVCAAAICLPVLHDFGRYALVASGRAGRALIIELPALVVLLIALASPGMWTGLFGVALIWLISEAVAVAISLFVFLPEITVGRARPLSWLRENRLVGLHYLSDFWLTNGLTNGGVILVGAIAGPAAAGALRATQVLLTPTLLLTRGAALALAPELTRAAKVGNRRRIRISVVLLAGATVATATGAVLVVMVLPSEILEALLGDTASEAVSVLPAAAIALAASGTAIAAGLGLRALGLIRLAVRSKLYTFPISLAGLLVGAVAGGAGASQIGMSIGEIARAASNWLTLGKKLRD